MRTLLGRKLANSVSSVGSMILFLIFASCSLIIIAAGASTYSRISDNFRNTFSSSSAVGYITNKIRSGDRAVIEEGGKGIAVYSGETVCAIMSVGEGLAERTVMADTYLGFSGGDMIFIATSMSVSLDDDGLYTITVNTGGESYTAYCRCKE